MILPASLSVINAVFVGKSRAVAFAVWGGTIGGMAALGPLVGGWLTTNASWHWAFLINVPIGIVVFIGVLMTVPETKELGGPKGMDVLGTVLITLGLLGIVFALIEGLRYGWITPIADVHRRLAGRGRSTRSPSSRSSRRRRRPRVDRCSSFLERRASRRARSSSSTCACSASGPSAPATSSRSSSASASSACSSRCRCSCRPRAATTPCRPA